MSTLLLIPQTKSVAAFFSFILYSRRISKSFIKFQFSFFLWLEEIRLFHLQKGASLIATSQNKAGTRPPLPKHDYAPEQWQGSDLEIKCYGLTIKILPVSTLHSDFLKRSVISKVCTGNSPQSKLTTTLFHKMFVMLLDVISVEVEHLLGHTLSTFFPSLNSVNMHINLLVYRHIHLSMYLYVCLYLYLYIYKMNTHCFQG